MNPILALIIANLIWGAASPIFKFALENIPPFTLAFIRFFLGGLIFIPFVIGKWQRLTIRQYLETITVGFFGISINIAFFFLGLQRTESINVPIIGSSAPIFIYFLSVLWLGEKPKLKVLIGLLTALAGVLVIIFSPILLNGKNIVFGEIQGNLFILIATFGHVLQTVIGKDLVKKVNSIQITVITFLVSSLTFLPFAITELSKWDLAMIDVRGVTGIIFGVFFSSALAYFLYFYGMSKMKAQEVGIFSYLDPIIAIIVAVPLLGEYPDLYYLLGSALVFGGIYLAEGRIHWHPWHRLRK